MIPAADLYRLLRRLIDQVDGDVLRRMNMDGFAVHPDLDDEDFATLARIVAGEPWEGSNIPLAEWEATSG